MSGALTQLGAARRHTSRRPGYVWIVTARSLCALFRIETGYGSQVVKLPEWLSRKLNRRGRPRENFCQRYDAVSPRNGSLVQEYELRLYKLQSHSTPNQPLTSHHLTGREGGPCPRSRLAIRLASEKLNLLSQLVVDFEEELDAALDCRTASGSDRVSRYLDLCSGK